MTATHAIPGMPMQFAKPPTGHLASEELVGFALLNMKSMLWAYGMSPAQCKTHISQREQMFRKMDQSTLAAVLLNELPIGYFFHA